MMTKTILAVAALVFGFGFVPGSNAGTDMIIDNSAQAPPPTTYYYAPPPPRVVYYAPPPVAVVVRPAVAYCGPRVRAYHHHRDGRRGFHRPFHGR